MTREQTALLAAVIALLATGWCGWRTHKLQERLDWLSRSSLPPPAEGGSLSVPPTNLEARLKKLEITSPHLGEIMSAIQLHFAKLYFAAEARNWDLARFERGEIMESLDAAAAIRPEERGVNLAGVIDALKQTQMEALKDSMDVKDRGLFREAYQESILVCNGCHQSTGRPFITISTPTNPPVGNQRWEPTP